MKHRVVQKCNCIDPIKLWKLNEPTDYIEVKKSKIENAGLGLFAIKDIPKNIAIDWYKGRITNEKVITHNRLYTWRFKSDLNSKPMRLEACVHEIGNPLAYVNTYADDEEKKLLNLIPKVVNEKVYYITSKKIKAGEELIISYGSKYNVRAIKNSKNK
mgnify:CR=1 FL=1